jgi:hypothetical protein
MFGGQNGTNAMLRAVGELLQLLLAPVDAGHGEPGGRQLLRDRAAELAARARHNRHTVAHGVSPSGQNVPSGSPPGW